MERRTQAPYYHDEIDLLDLISKFWKEKTLIFSIIGLCLIASIAYALTSPKVFEAKAQLQKPSNSDLAPINNNFYSITPDEAFGKLLARLESDAHKQKLLKDNKELIQSTLNIDNDLDGIVLLSNHAIRSISYPDPKDTASTPNIYEISLSGSNENDTLSKLLDKDIELASTQVFNDIKSDFERLQKFEEQEIQTKIELLSNALKQRRENTITQLREAQELELKKLQDELSARMEFTLAIREDRIIELEQAINIANKLGISSPSEWSFASTPTDETGETSQQAPLYLRGSKLLIAELESLKSTPKNAIFDTKIRELQSQINQVKTNRDIEILQARKNDHGFSEELQRLKEQLSEIKQSKFPESFSLNFQNTKAITPNKPIKPNKVIIVIIGGFLGLLLAFAAATTKMMIRAIKAKELETGTKRHEPQQHFSEFLKKTSLRHEEIVP